MTPVSLVEGGELTKLEVARRQLGTALALFLNNQDPVSVHVLASGGAEISQSLAQHGGQAAFASLIHTDISPTLEEQYQRARTVAWNAFKHFTTRGQKAVRDDSDILAAFTDCANDALLFVGWYDYQLVAPGLPIEAQAFLCWYLALHDDPSVGELDPFKVSHLLPTDLKVSSRKRQKAALRRLCAKARRIIMRDPRTERRPLIIPA